MQPITQPFTQPPSSGEVVTICPGVLWARMPLPIALDHINVYLIDTGEGWIIIDTGMKGEEGRHCWQRIIDNHLCGKPVVGVLATHMHPDHIGQAGWLVDKYRVPFYMTMAEYFQARSFSIPNSRPISWRSEQYYRRSGLNQEQIAAVSKVMARFSKVVEPLPNNYVRLSDGQWLQWGEHRWQVVVGRGHSPEHACLYCPSMKILLAGDQVIADITPNVSVIPVEPDGEPLRQWFESIERFKLLDDDVLVLPSHKLPFYGLHQRLEDIRQHHENHLNDLLAATLSPKSAVELLPVLFKRSIADGVLTLALGECVAHLHELILRGCMERVLVDDVYLFRALTESTQSPSSSSQADHLSV